MKEQLISFKTAKLAKEKGFDNSIYGSYINQNLWYLKDGTLCFCEWDEELESVDDFLFKTEDLTPRPTQALLQKWLREEYNVYISSIVDATTEPKFTWTILKFEGNAKDLTEKEWTWDFSNSSFLYKTYEEALEEGLYEALKLIN
jgi:hypothetical protein